MNQFEIRSLVQLRNACLGGVPEGGKLGARAAHHVSSYVMLYSVRCDTKPSPPIVKAALPELEQRRLCSRNCEGQQHSHQDVVKSVRERRDPE